ncbi:MAG: helix-turn-helix transcriptional regulator [Bacillota bacterium]|nr:helix-turn-helix transcriptional regulator [Bacillota bacterium]
MAKKEVYLNCRKKLDLTRDQASELLEVISVDRLERIENGRIDPTPSDIKIMSEKYKNPSLCNYYCTHECDIGKEYVPEVQIKNISQIVLETLSAVNRIRENQYRLIDITLDGQITNDELRDFIRIKHDLDFISTTIDSLQLCKRKIMICNLY